MLWVEDIHDDDWFVEPDLTVKGSTGVKRTELLFDADEFANGTFKYISLKDGNLVFNPVKHLNEEFNMGGLDSEIWEVLNNGTIRFRGSTMHLTSDMNGSYPLVVTKGNVFPEDADWCSRMQLTFSYNDDYVEGFGIGMTVNETDPNESMVAIFGNRSLPPNYNEYYVWMNGEPIDDWLFDDYNFGTLEVSYFRENDTYVVFHEGTYWSFVSDVDSPTRFWIGCPYYAALNSPTYYEMVVDSLDLWTFKGTWTSRVFDLGGTIEKPSGNVNFDTSHWQYGRVQVEARVSYDNQTWSDWTRLDPNKGIFEGRYFQFRSVLAMDGLRAEDAHLKLRNFKVEFQHPVERVALRLNGGDWTNTTGISSWDIDIKLVEDRNVLEVRAYDTSGFYNETIFNLILDTTQPVGTAWMNFEGQFTNDRNLTFKFNATDKYGLKGIRIALSSDYRDEEVVEPYVEMLEWTLPGGFVKTDVYIRFEDNHGLLSDPIHMVFYHDPLLPTGTIQIEGGDPHTDKQSVHIDMSYQDNTGIAHVELSNDPLFRDFITVPLGDHQYSGWDLSSGGSGNRMVYMRIIDLAGNHVILSDDIDLFVATAGGGIAIVGDVAATASTIVQLSITGPIDFEAMWMQISEDPAFQESTWSDLSQYSVISLTEGDGRREIFVRFKDAREYTTKPVSTTILLDTTPPDISIVLNEGVYLIQTNEAAVLMEYDDILDPGEMWVSGTNDLSQATPTPLSYSFQWSFPDDDGIHTLNVWVSDGVGNIGHVSASVYYALVPPYCIPSIVGGKYSNSIEQLEIEAEVFDQYGLPVEVQLGFDGDPPGDAEWIASSGILSVPIPNGTDDGSYIITVKCRNSLGMVGNVTSTEVILDRKPPTLTVREPSDGSRYQLDSAIIDLRIDHWDENGVTHGYYMIDSDEWIAFDLDSKVTKIDLGKMGKQRLHVSVADQAGNTESVILEFSIESEPPSPLMLIGVLVIGIVTVGVVVGLLSRKRAGWS
jgi:hypothetical protein